MAQAAAALARWRPQIGETVHDKHQHPFRLERERPHALSELQARLAVQIALHNFCFWLNAPCGRLRLAFKASACYAQVFLDLK